MASTVHIILVSADTSSRYLLNITHNMVCSGLRNASAIHIRTHARTTHARTTHTRARTHTHTHQLCDGNMGLLSNSPCVSTRTLTHTHTHTHTSFATGTWACWVTRCLPSKRPPASIARVRVCRGRGGRGDLGAIKRTLPVAGENEILSNS